MNWEDYSRSMLEACRQREKPFFACFELTPLCNFQCNMCYIRLTPEMAQKQGAMLTTQQWLGLAGEAKRMGVLSLEVTGGEAMTRPDFSVLFEALSRMGFVINLRSNGYLLRGERLELLRRCRPQRISVTLYGASDATYQKICGVADGFSTVTENILAARAAGLNLHLSMMVTRDNNDDRRALNEWAEKHDFRVTPHGGLITPIRSAERSVEHLQVRMEEPGSQRDSALTAPRDIPDRASYASPFWMCRGFGGMLCITWDGRMTLCNALPAVWKDALSGSLEDTYHAMYAELKQIKRPAKCEGCDYIDFCAACPSQLYSATHHVDQTCEAVCERARRRYQRYVQLGMRHEPQPSEDLCERGRCGSEGE